MKIKEIIAKTNRYINGQSNLPILVDLPNADMLIEYRLHYNVGHHEIIEAGHYCGHDNLPMMDKLKNDLGNKKDTMFLFGLEPFLQLQGRDVVISEIKSLMQLSCAGKLIIVTLACSDLLKAFDKHFFEAGRILMGAGKPQPLPTLNFTSPLLREYIEQSIDGINGLPKMIVLLESGANYVNILTKKQREDFPNSMFDIEERNSAFQVVAGYYQDLASINEKAGSQEQWISLLQKTARYEKLSEYVTKRFGSISNLSFTIEHFSNLSMFDKWLYFICLLVYGAKGNDYLSIVVSKSETFADFINNCFCEILNHSPRDKNFITLYNQRRKVVAQLLDYVDELSFFCKQVYGKKENALYYLTDLSTKEKELTIELLHIYKPSQDSMLSILKSSYPDLAAYLSTFDFGNDYLNKYFRLYKYCKVTNQILPELREMVEEQAQQRQYNEWLRPRSEIVDNLKAKSPNDILYFMDAMGVEFLGYMQEKCFEYNLLFHADIARCELPSITSINKGFVQEFKNSKCTVIDNKELDDLKHEGQNTYNYENTKLPIHIVEEINILNKLIDQLKALNANQTAYVIADHGASRLAVIGKAARV